MFVLYLRRSFTSPAEEIAIHQSVNRNGLADHEDAPDLSFLRTSCSSAFPRAWKESPSPYWRLYQDPALRCVVLNESRSW